MKTVSVVIPAYNEQERIKRTLEAYHTFFSAPAIRQQFQVNWIVIPNGCSDNTTNTVEQLKSNIDRLHVYPITTAGKGLAVHAGFKRALEFRTDYIGVMDADMSTKPEAFCALLEKLEPHHGVIASRYMKGSQVYPPRPLIKRWGSRFIYEPLVRMFLGLHFHDLQCGEKIFKYDVIQTVLPYLSIPQWAYDIELLYLCKKAGFTIHEQPTVWQDQVGSKLKIMSSGMRMLKSLFEIRSRHRENPAFNISQDSARDARTWEPLKRKF